MRRLRHWGNPAVCWKMIWPSHSSQLEPRPLALSWMAEQALWFSVTQWKPPALWLAPQPEYCCDKTAAPQSLPRPVSCMNTHSKLVGIFFHRFIFCHSDVNKGHLKISYDLITNKICHICSNNLLQSVFFVPPSGVLPSSCSPLLIPIWF